MRKPEPSNLSKSPTVRTLADITLVPTPVTIRSGLRGDVRVEEWMRAELLADLKDQPITLVAAAAMTAEPWTEVGRFECARIGPRAAGGKSPWELMFDYRHKRRHLSICRDFPVDPVILLRGAHTLDVKEIIGSVPYVGTHYHRYRDESYPALWALVSTACEQAAGADRVLIDTTAEAIRFQIDWLKQWKPRKQAEVKESTS